MSRAGPWKRMDALHKNWRFIDGMDEASKFRLSPILGRVANIPLGAIFANRPVIELGPSQTDVDMNAQFAEIVEDLGKRVFTHLLVYGFVAYRYIDDEIEIVDPSDGMVIQMVERDMSTTLHFIWRRDIPSRSRSPLGIYQSMTTVLSSVSIEYALYLEHRSIYHALQQRKINSPHIFKRTLPVLKPEEYQIFQQHATFSKARSPRGFNFDAEIHALSNFTLLRPALSDQDEQIMRQLDYGRYYHASKNRQTGDIIVGELVDAKPIAIPDMSKQIAEEEERLRNITAECLGLHQLASARLQKQAELIQDILRSWIGVYSQMLEKCINAILYSTYGAFLKDLATAPRLDDASLQESSAAQPTRSEEDAAQTRIRLRPRQIIPEKLWDAMQQAEAPLDLFIQLALGEDAMQFFSDKIHPGQQVTSSARDGDAMDTRGD